MSSSRREAALTIAASLGGSDEQVIRRAIRFYRWLESVRAVRLEFRIGPAQPQGTAPIEGLSEEATMAQLHDDQQVDVSVRAVDAKGFEVDVDLSATVEDPSVATVEELADGKTFRVVAGNPGSTIVTVTTGELEATLAVDVVAGDVALVQLSVGDPVKQSAPADQPSA